MASNEGRGGGKGRGRWAYNYGGAAEEKRYLPWAVPTVVVGCVALFVVTMYVNNCPAQSKPFGKCVWSSFLRRFSFQPLRQNPLLGPSSSTLLKLGALDWSRVVHQHQGWRLVTCIWLHAGVVHLLVNMICLILAGIRLEQQFGFARVATIFLLSGFGGSVLSSLFVRYTVSVGASGALSGLLGSMLSELFTNWTIYSSKVAALLTIIFIIVINLGIGIFPHVDNYAHIGGFLTGFLLGFILLMRPQFGWMEGHNLPTAGQDISKHKPYQYILVVIALLLLIAGFTVGLIMVFRGVNASDHCSWCHYLNCWPTSRWDCNN